MTDNLQVESIFLYPKENAKAHKTDLFELIHDEVSPVPILRRGLKFTLAIRFANRRLDETNDQIRLLFNFGEHPDIIKGTRGLIKLDLSKRRTKVVNTNIWTGKVLAIESDSISLEVYTPCTIPVGIWNLEVETSVVNSTTPTSSKYNYEGDIYFLFNPWACHDLVYMPDERRLDEYILADVGKIWVGPYGSSRGREWVFGQFDACVLPAAMLMLSRSEMVSTSRGDPVKIARIISKLVNSNDDDGILVGRWDGEYEDGTSPSAWTGSVPILEEFFETQLPVAYGQCWVFAGVVTTICRALGIPSRVVTNLVSAHDANATLTIDKYYDENNEEMQYDPNNPLGMDSIWNYHVWNDVWMARPDLPPGYGGWQAIDATPQETSSGVYQCGPASLEAIKKGHAGFSYDVDFMISTVNADLMRWKRDETSDLGYTRLCCNKYHIGRFILTKLPFAFDPNGDKDREDITSQYKDKEGTEAERMSFYAAVRGSKFGNKFYDLPNPESEDVEFDLEEIERIKIGENFCVVVRVKNKSDEKRTLKAILSASSVYYNGINGRQIKQINGEFILKPKSEEVLRMTVKADDYLDKLVEYCNLKLYAIVGVKETHQSWADEDDFQVLKPHIDIRVPAEISLNKSIQITLRFVNPLKKRLTNCKFNVSGPTLLRNMIVPYGDVKPGELIKISIEVVPRSEGEKKLVATFSSKELLDISGSTKVEVVSEE